MSSDELSEVLSPFSTPDICNPFTGLESLCNQEKFFQDNFNYVVRIYTYREVDVSIKHACTRMQPPIERVLGRNYQLAPRSGSMKEVCDCCYDVPLLSSLQALLKCSDVRDQVYI